MPSSFQRILARVILVGMVLFFSPTTSIAILPIDDQGSTPCKMAIQFLQPFDWRCTNDDDSGCVECRNVSERSTLLAIHCVGQTKAEQQRVPSGAEISICHGDKNRNGPLI